MTKRFPVLVLLVGGLAVAGWAMADGDAPPAGPQSRILPVSVMTAEVASSFETRRTYTGRIEAARVSQLAFERVGVLEQVDVDEGAHVDGGQLLARLGTRELVLDRASAVAERDGAAARLDEMVAGPRKETIEAARAIVQDLEAQLALAQRRKDRRAALAKSNSDAISSEKIEEAEFEYTSARARLERGRHVLNELETGTRPEQIASQRALVRRLDARIASIDVSIAKSELRAPFAGTIAKRHADDGAILSPNQPLLELVESDVLEARIGLPMEDAGRIAIGETVQLEIAGASMKATLRARHPQLDEATRTRLHIFRLADAPDSIVRGQIVRIALSVQVKTEGIWVPQSALVRAPRGLWACYVVEEGRVGRREVQIAHADGARAYVRGTLRAGDLVIRNGSHRVVAGQRVQVENG